MLVVTGAGGAAFCAGAVLRAIETFAPRLDDSGGPLGFTRRIPAKPAIAAIEGWCLAGGLELALWCDLRIATEGSPARVHRAALRRPPDRRWDAAPAADVGLGRALDLILSGRVVETDEALALGLVGEVVLPGRHVARALEIAEGLAGTRRRRCSPTAARLYDGLGLPLADGLAVEARGARRDVRRRGGRRGAVRRGRGPRRGGRRGIGIGWRPIPVGRDHS